MEHCCDIIADDTGDIKRRQKHGKLIALLPLCDTAPEIYDALVKAKAILATAELMLASAKEAKDIPHDCRDSECVTYYERLYDSFIPFWADMVVSANRDAVSQAVKGNIIGQLFTWTGTLSGRQSRVGALPS